MENWNYYGWVVIVLQQTNIKAGSTIYLRTEPFTHDHRHYTVLTTRGEWMGCYSVTADQYQGG